MVIQQTTCSFPVLPWVACFASLKRSYPQWNDTMIRALVASILGHAWKEGTNYQDDHSFWP